MLLEQTIAKMGTMRLTSMANSFKERLSRGDHNDLSVEEFVGLLIDDEFSARQNRRLSRMIGKADFKPENACIENIIYNPTRGFQKKDIMQFTQTTWLNNCQNIIFVGPTGTGKTYLSETIGLQACKMGFPVKKIRLTRLFEEIRSHRGAGLYLKFVEKLNKFKVLIIDDFLMANVTNQDLTELMDVLEDRNMRSSIIITTQYPINKWHSLLPDPTVADAICDRLKHGSIIFNLKGESMRKKYKK
ncbi:MAG: IS21-like element helper ATPase IstB [Candidatus Omnitrophica bacterium]|nr:IS21-like element helper ATPase IstB [Candidatus Omnitrophota bacterium]